MEAEELLKYMLNFFQDIDKQIKEIENELSQKDLEQQDILHYIENNTLNAGGYAKTGKLLKEVRADRRSIKDDLDKAYCIRDTLTTKYNNKLITGDIINTLKGLSAIKKRSKRYVNKTNILNGLEDKHDNKNTAYVQIKKEQSTNFSK